MPTLKSFEELNAFMSEDWSQEAEKRKRPKFAMGVSMPIEEIDNKQKSKWLDASLTGENELEDGSIK